MSPKSQLLALFAILFGLSSTSLPGGISSDLPQVSAAVVASTDVTATGGCFLAALSGAHELPPNASAATGTAVFIISPTHPKLTYRLEHNVADETATHISRGASGSSGSSIANGSLPPGSVKEGVIDLDAQSLTDLAAGLLYVNIRSSSFADGEIRGQIMPAGGCFDALLSGANEVPPVTTSASGHAVFALWPDQSKLTYHVVFRNLGGFEQGVHLHQGGVGVTGPLITELVTLANGLPNAKDGTLMLPSQYAAELLAGRLYVNIHSSAYGTGEIRGQIMPSATCFTAKLSSLSEVATPPISSSANGSGMFMLLSGQTQLRYRIEHDVAGETAAHIHKGAPGLTGPPITDGVLAIGLFKEGIVSLSTQEANDLLAGLLYVNIHSTTYREGEIRGQIVPGSCLIQLPLVAKAVP